MQYGRGDLPGIEAVPACLRGDVRLWGEMFGGTSWRGAAEYGFCAPAEEFQLGHAVGPLLHDPFGGRLFWTSWAPFPSVIFSSSGVLDVMVEGLRVRVQAEVGHLRLSSGTSCPRWHSSRRWRVRRALPGGRGLPGGGRWN